MILAMMLLSTAPPTHLRMMDMDVTVLVTVTLLVCLRSKAEHCFSVSPEEGVICEGMT